MDAVRTIRDFNAGREQERLALKYRNMRASPFAFLRGTCHLFYDRLPADKLFRKAPLVWSCGDLHLENFGSYKGDNRLVYFDINDFDEAALAPATWDLVRLLASVLLAGDTLHVRPPQALQLCRLLLESYAQALVLGKARWVERETAQGLVRQLLESLRGRSRVDFLNTRTERRRRRRTIRCDGRHALPASEAQRERVTAMIGGFASDQPDPGFFEVLDVARRVAGTGSLGVDRFAVLVAGKGSPDGNYLLDLKQALPSALASHLKIAQPKWPSQAHRVAELQRRLQAVSMAFLQPIVEGKLGYLLRGLQPSEDRVDLGAAGIDPASIEGLMQEMGRLLAWAQLRSAGRQGSAIADALIDFGAARGRWQEPLCEAARVSAKQVVRDWRVFIEADEAGAFSGH